MNIIKSTARYPDDVFRPIGRLVIAQAAASESPRIREQCAKLQALRPLLKMIMEIRSNSQNNQDLWVIQLFSGKRDGYFFEIGGGDGLWISNTLVLERDFGWTGILVEPTSAYAKLVRNRPGSICDDSCIASEEKDVTLFEIFDRGQAGISELARDNSLLSAVRDDLTEAEGGQTNSYWGEFRHAVKKKAYPLQTVLAKHGAPAVIDYFSLDVEGYEYEVFRNFPFSDYKFRCIGVERPPVQLHQLLIANGYVGRVQLGEDVMYTHRTEF